MFLKEEVLIPRAFIAIFLSLSMLVVDHRYSSFEPIRQTLSIATEPLQALAELPVKIPRGIYQLFISRQTLKADVEYLHKENLILRARMQRMAVLEDENKRLMTLLNSSSRIGERVLIAEVAWMSMSPYSHRIRVNKGISSRVFSGQPVLNADAVIGQVVHVSRSSADVLLITDNSHALPVQIQRNGLRTIAIGDSQQQLNLPYLANNADIKVGDTLITSGMGERFPSGYPVATITTITTDGHSPFAKIKATPIAQLDKIREIMLVWQIDKKQQIKTKQEAEKNANL